MLAYYESVVQGKRAWEGGSLSGSHKDYICEYNILFTMLRVNKNGRVHA